MSILGSFSGGIIGMILNAGPVAKSVMVILLFFSVVSWTIIFFKLKQLSRVEKEGKKVISLLTEADSLKKLLVHLKNMRESPYYTLAVLAYEGQTVPLATNPKERKENVLDTEKRLRIAIEEENERLEKYLPFLATTANTAPFVGLFGTVWGIMDSFREIGIRGTTSLAVVAPGISEALIATAFGLATAIPAVIGYNYLLARQRRISTHLENFVTYLLGLIEK